MLRFAPLLMLAACAPAVPPPAANADRFARELAGRTSGPTRTCIPTTQGANLRVIDASTLAYDRGSTLWVNRLESACPALSPYNTVIIDSSPGEYCRGDRIQGLEPGAIIPGPKCILRDWTPYQRR